MFLLPRVHLLFFEEGKTPEGPFCYFSWCSASPDRLPLGVGCRSSRAVSSFPSSISLPLNWETYGARRRSSERRSYGLRVVWSFKVSLILQEATPVRRRTRPVRKHVFTRAGLRPRLLKKGTACSCIFSADFALCGSLCDPSHRAHVGL